MSFIKRAWRGEERLWKVFWIHAVLLITLSTVPLWGMSTKGFFVFLFFPFYLTYAAWWSISLWRCAFNTAWKICGYLARIYALVGWFMHVFLFLGSLTLLADDLISESSKCKNLIRAEAVRAGIDYEVYRAEHPNAMQEICHINMPTKGNEKP